MTTALVLAGHGSHITPSTAGVAWKHVDALRAMGIADEVTAAFWKEMPSFHRVIHSLTAEDITIVPLFTAQGYFTRTVIPTEMGLDGAITRRDGRTLRYARTLSEHPYLASVVRQRIEDMLSETGLLPSQTAVAIIGHGTTRSPESRIATESQASAIREAGMAAEVVAVYLEDAPGIPDVYRLTRAPNIIAVPYFLAPGSHTTLDVPQALRLLSSEIVGSVQGRTVYYTPPVGTEESLREVILELAREAGASLNPPGDGSRWNCFPAAGRDRLRHMIEQEGEMTFGQLHLTPNEVRVEGDSGPLDAMTDPAALRARIRENPFRPLATARDLPGGWRVSVSTPETLHAIVETIYPGAVADWAASLEGKFTRGSLGETVMRQTGMFRKLADFRRDSDVTANVCGKCILYPTWLNGADGGGLIPCAEPCNFWMSRALEADE